MTDELKFNPDAPFSGPSFLTMRDAVEAGISFVENPSRQDVTFGAATGDDWTIGVEECEHRVTLGEFRAWLKAQREPPQTGAGT